MKKSTKCMVGALISFVMSLLIFGEVYSTLQYIVLPVSTIVMGILINYKWNTLNNGWFSPNYYFSIFLGYIMSIFKLNPFILTPRDTILSLTMDTSFSIIGWWLCIISVSFLAVSYRNLKKSEYMEEFDNILSAERESKINHIIGKWWK